MKHMRRIAIIAALCALMVTVMAGTALAARPAAKAKKVVKPAPIVLADAHAKTDTVAMGSGKEYYLEFSASTQTFDFYVDPVLATGPLTVETLTFDSSDNYWKADMVSISGTGSSVSSGDCGCWYMHSSPVLLPWEGGKVTISYAGGQDQFPKGMWVRFTYWGASGATIGYDFTMPAWPIPDC